MVRKLWQQVRNRRNRDTASRTAFAFVIAILLKYYVEDYDRETEPFLMYELVEVEILYMLSVDFAMKWKCTCVVNHLSSI
jgi:hypothetical protein